MKRASIHGLRRPFGIYQDTRGRLFIAELLLNAVLVYNEQNEFLGYLGPQGLQKETPPEAVFKGPHSIDEDSRGKIYISSYYGKTIHRYDSDLKRLEVFLDRSKVSEDWHLTGQSTLTIADDDHVYVSDFDSSSIQHFLPNGQFQRWLGFDENHPEDFRWRIKGRPKPTRSAMGFDHVHDLCFDEAQNLFICDTWNHRIQKFSAAGDYVGWIGWDQKNKRIKETFSPDGEVGESPTPGGFNACAAIDIAGTQLLVSNVKNNRIDIFDTSGRFQKICIDPSVPWEAKPANPRDSFAWPYDCKFIKEGIAVADTNHGRVIFVPFPA